MNLNASNLPQMVEERVSRIHRNGDVDEARHVLYEAYGQQLIDRAHFVAFRERFFGTLTAILQPQPVLMPTEPVPSPVFLRPVA